ncbi:MAG: ankyrin repeat protein [Hyperionvirus sp.]|uniref:NAD(+)--protein-arginine ADP-ribosyltransferase n=1 Tax=Hyperionvirus sp. TaxID=2487770 RepID=A0A3G5A848_9VIRU|nr:MAG: ankyrin repeat protein [Hyperionvirus sp.]
MAAAAAAVADNYDDLMCPVTYDFLEEPVVAPCCGRAVSKAAFVMFHIAQGRCPVCNQELPDYDPTTAKKQVNLAYLVEEAKKKMAIKPTCETKEGAWYAEINTLFEEKSAYQTIIGRLEFKNTDKRMKFKTLLIPVVDQSGSMGTSATGAQKPDSPILQCIYSLNRILDASYRNKNLDVCYVGYHDTAKHVYFDKSKPVEFYRTMVNRIDRDYGGTNFRAAFEEIERVCEVAKGDDSISNIEILFLTDGECQVVPKERRGELVASLKLKLDGLLAKKSYTVHSVGFAKDHDYAFLNNLCKIGTHEGAYRYANPTDSVDALSGKINSVLDVILGSVVVPLVLMKSPFSVIGDAANGRYWVNLTNCNLTEAYKFLISIQGAAPIEIDTKFVHFVDSKKEEDNSELWDQWYSYLIDGIAGELLGLSKGVKGGAVPLDKQLHLELLIQRSRALVTRLKIDSPNAIRLEKLVESIKIIIAGGEVDEKKLNDMKFEGLYPTAAVAAGGAHVPLEIKGGVIQAIPARIPVGQWAIIPRKHGRRCHSVVFGNSKNAAAIDWIKKNVGELPVHDGNGSNMLIVAANIGRSTLVEAILETKSIDLNATNNAGYTALDLAALYGYVRTYEILRSAGAKLTIDGETLFRTCISNKYTELGKCLLRDNVAVITDDLIGRAPNSVAFEWLNRMAKKEISVETAILKGSVEIVKEKIGTLDRISWKPYLEIFAKCENDPDYLKIVDLLLENKKCEVDEVMDVLDSMDVKEKTWPMFMACEKGLMKLFGVLKKYCRKEHVNMVNLRGTSALWISCCNRHIDIANELLLMGADPNLCNLKGDPPLIPACQKGSESIVQLLLASGARLDLYNKNRDNPVLIACRCGQSKILEIFLKKLSVENPAGLASILETSADIDGLVPLTAACELNKVDCIRVCLKYGAKIEWRTADDNKILPGATAFHLGCFYGRFESVQLLVESKADIHSQTKVHRYTGLHLAIKYAHPKIIRYLLSIDQVKNVNTLDADGRLPAYYAQMLGNEAIYEEFFTDKLSTLLGKVLMAPTEMESLCVKTLMSHGRSIGTYDYKFVEACKMDGGMGILAGALINGNKFLVDGLVKMGASFEIKDDRGVPAAFWANYMGYDGKLSVEAQEVSKMMTDRLKIVEKQSFQNKLLLTMNTTALVVDKEADPINLHTKMSQNYLLKIKSELIAVMNKSTESSQSLLGLIEKMKSNKAVVTGAQMLNEAAVHMISLIATDESKLDPIHMLCIYLYTGNLAVYNQVNIAMTEWNKNRLWQPFVISMMQGMKSLPSYKGECYRCVDTKFDEKDYALGTEIRWSSFSIATREYSYAKELITNKRGIVFIVQSTTGRDISKYSKFTIDREIIFQPGTKFRIISHYKADMICLAQKNIRKSTFATGPSDLDKATRGIASIIVELEEIP